MSSEVRKEISVNFIPDYIWVGTETQPLPDNPQCWRGLDSLTLLTLRCNGNSQLHIFWLQSLLITEIFKSDNTPDAFWKKSFSSFTRQAQSEPIKLPRIPLMHCRGNQELQHECQQRPVHRSFCWTDLVRHQIFPVSKDGPGSNAQVTRNLKIKACSITSTRGAITW